MNSRQKQRWKDDKAQIWDLVSEYGSSVYRTYRTNYAFHLKKGYSKFDAEFEARKTTILHYQTLRGDYGE